MKYKRYKPIKVIFLLTLLIAIFTTLLFIFKNIYIKYIFIVGDVLFLYLFIGSILSFFEIREDCLLIKDAVYSSICSYNSQFLKKTIMIENIKSIDIVGENTLNFILKDGNYIRYSINFFNRKDKNEILNRIRNLINQIKNNANQLGESDGKVRSFFNIDKLMAIIFIILGTCSIIPITFYALNSFFDENPPGALLLFMCIFYAIMMIIGIITVIANKPSRVIQNILLLTSGIIGGAFYAIWMVGILAEINNKKQLKQTASSLSWFCPKCGKKNYFKKECECGYIKKKDYIDNSNNKSYSICQKCNHINDKDAIYCVRCGEPIKADSKKGL